VLDDQVKQGNVVRNVARLVDRVAADPKKFRTLTTDEMFRILDHDTRDRHLWALAMMCGLRRGEIAGLKWCNVNLTDKPSATATMRYRRSICASRKPASTWAGK
jgi:integrase